MNNGAIKFLYVWLVGRIVDTCRLVKMKNKYIPYIDMYLYIARRRDVLTHLCATKKEAKIFSQCRLDEQNIKIFITRTSIVLSHFVLIHRPLHSIGRMTRHFISLFSCAHCHYHGRMVIVIAQTIIDRYQKETTY